WRHLQLHRAAGIDTHDRSRAGCAGIPEEAPSRSAAGTAMDPKNVVPIIVWLASDAGGVANGRIFGASGHRISLYSEPYWERTLFTDEPYFDIDKLFEE